MSKVLSIKLAIYLGEVTYGLYVFHIIGFHVASPIFSKFHITIFGLNYFLYILVSLIITLGLATISYYCYERPFIKLKNKFTAIRKGIDTSA